MTVDDLGSTAGANSSFHYAYLAWTMALVGALGSLFFGEVMELVPCTLCWYQRICLFPLPVILAVGIVRRDDALAAYALPLAVAGLATALYHVGIQIGWIPETLSPCTGGTPCGERQIEWLGFLTIPLMSAAAFSAILACLVAHGRQARP